MSAFMRAFVLVWLLCPVAAAAIDLPPAVQVEGEIEENEDLSAIAATEGFLVVGSDEKNSIQVLDRTSKGFKAGKLIRLLEGEEDEADIEGIAVRRGSQNGDLSVFVIGCHCENRRDVEDDKTVAKNLERLGTVREEASRANVFRLTVKASSGRQVGEVGRVSLADILQRHPILGRFANVPSKENGIDIEGLAVGPDGKLFAGFRGPVLRGNFVPVLAFDFDSPRADDIRFVNLGGLGIRDLAAVEGGFLILAGPVGDGHADFRIFFWDGRDTIPGTDRRDRAVITELAEVPLPNGHPDAKAEGLAVLLEDDRSYEVFLLFDGPPGGRLTRVTLPKARR